MAPSVVRDERLGPRELPGVVGHNTEREVALRAHYETTGSVPPQAFSPAQRNIRPASHDESRLSVAGIGVYVPDLSIGPMLSSRRGHRPAPEKAGVRRARAIHSCGGVFYHGNGSAVPTSTLAGTVRRSRRGSRLRRPRIAEWSARDRHRSTRSTAHCGDPACGESGHRRRCDVAGEGHLS